ncbi:MAG: alanine racemase [candidate division Zixibacteria bacterium]|nr:alanine racemase [candidate division Zixibacteria bacterium]
MNNKTTNWIEVSRSAVLSNLDNLSQLAGRKTKIAVAVKADGYGHGLREMTAILSDSDIPYLAVHSTIEAEMVRMSGWDRKIMMVGPVLPEDIDSIFRLDLEPIITEPSILAQLGKFCRKSSINTRIHLKTETGTNRQGMTEAELKKVITILKKYPELTVQGVSTHFANIEDTTDHSYAKTQLKRFKQLVGILKKAGVKPRLRHTACSAALLLFKETYFDLARPGISVYGYWPSTETYVSYRLGGGKNSILTPALSLYSRITQIKTIEADNFIGYGCTYRTTSRTKIAILPIGYSDGLDRRLSNLGYVLINGRRAPIRGRICMNLTMVDITDIPRVKLYDKATIIGIDGKETISADTHASWCQSINYDILAGLSPLVPRFIV